MPAHVLLFDLTDRNLSLDNACPPNSKCRILCSCGSVQFLGGLAMVESYLDRGVQFDDGIAKLRGLIPRMQLLTKSAE